MLEVNFFVLSDYEDSDVNETFLFFVNNIILTSTIILFKQSPINHFRHFFNPSSKGALLENLGGSVGHSDTGVVWI